VQDYLLQQRDGLTVLRLPGYAPGLNPVETLWGNIKGQELANRCAEDLEELDAAVRSGMARVEDSHGSRAPGAAPLVPKAARLFALLKT
jgi:hypothetical protein